MTFVAYSPEADNDLSDIENHSSQRWGDARTAAYIQDIFAAVRRLAVDPASGRSRSDITAPYMVAKAGRHLIVYRYLPEVDTVEILTILHEAMNIRQRVRRTSNTHH